MVLGIAFLILTYSGVSLWRCPINYFCHFECPGCGLTRGILAFFKIEVIESFKLNPLAPFVALGLIITFAVVFLDLILQKINCEKIYNKLNSIIDKHKVLFISMSLAWVIFIVVFKNL